MSSALVILHEDSDSFSEVEHDNPDPSLEYANVKNSIIYVASHERKASICKLCRSKNIASYRLQTQERNLYTVFMILNWLLLWLPQ